jgi:2-(1,2-epoxy-1,2-dihydrophenyl)acetyl-CoA isomerase
VIYKSLTLQVKGGLARLTLAEPESRNALDRTMCVEFCAAAHELAGRGDVRCVLLSAQGKYFSVGGDVNTLSADLDGMPDTVRDLTSPMHLGLSRLCAMDAPLVACVQGIAAGGAVSLVANCDLVFSARSARFAAAFSGLGFSCDSGASFGLVSRMGLSRARRFLILSEMLDADEALKAGLVDYVADDGMVYAQAEAAAIALAKGPTRAYGEIRRLCSRALGQSFESQLENEAQSMNRLAATHDAKAGVRARAEKLTPRFQGS